VRSRAATHLRLQPAGGAAELLDASHERRVGRDERGLARGRVGALAVERARQRLDARHQLVALAPERLDGGRDRVRRAVELRRGLVLRGGVGAGAGGQRAARAEPAHARLGKDAPFCAARA